MSLRSAVRCLTTLLIAVLSVVSPAWASPEGASANCGLNDPLASITAPQISAEPGTSPEALNPLQTSELKSDTSCCTQEEIQSCYASATPENGCHVAFVGCSRFSAACFCVVDCPQ